LLVAASLSPNQSHWFSHWAERVESGNYIWLGNWDGEDKLASQLFYPTAVQGRINKIFWWLQEADRRICLSQAQRTELYEKVELLNSLRLSMHGSDPHKSM
jgi:hypothetical protein